MKLTKATMAAAILATGIMLCPQDVFAWGQKGHDVTCAVARAHLKKKVRRKIDRVLDGQSIVYWSNWLDNASHSERFAYTKTWHYKNIDADETYENAVPNPEGDVLTAIQAQIAALKSGTLDKESEALALKMLVHLVGDLHCPMHMGHKSDRGGNRWQVQFFGNGKNLHGIWDSDILESAHKWTFSEWAEEIDTGGKPEYSEIVSGTPEDWGRETYQLATQIYEQTPVGSKLSYDEVARWAPVIENQLLKGGLRLAAILNDIYN
ncbi:MAG: S1/P1 nuclease [Candidatus Cryptobacteroides sp.]